MSYLYTLVELSTFPIITALLLGIMTIISPCPFCSNLTAIVFIGRDIKRRRTVLWSGVLFVLGKVVTYLALACIFIFGVNILPIQEFLERYGEPFMGPFLILCGLLLFDFFRLSKHDHHQHGEKSGWREKLVAQSKQGNLIWAFILGILFSLAFCPYSGMLFFGMLIPITVAESGGVLLPIMYGLGTGIPVLIVSWLLAYGLGSVVRITNRVKEFEVWIRRGCALLFIGVGIYMCITIWGGGHQCNHPHHAPHEHCEQGCTH